MPTSSTATCSRSASKALGLQLAAEVIGGEGQRAIGLRRSVWRRGRDSLTLSTRHDGYELRRRRRRFKRFCRDTPLEGMYRQARAARIYDGPDEVHRMVVARRVLQQYSQGGAYDFE